MLMSVATSERFLLIVKYWSCQLRFSRCVSCCIWLHDELRGNWSDIFLCTVIQLRFYGFFTFLLAGVLEFFLLCCWCSCYVSDGVKTARPSYPTRSTFWSSKWWQWVPTYVPLEADKNGSFSNMNAWSSALYYNLHRADIVGSENFL